MNRVTFAEAVNNILQGKLVAYPTETFYAVGCDALNPVAVQNIYRAKFRSSSSPLPAIIGDASQLGKLVARVSPEAGRLMDIFWPGPLTLVLPVADGVPAFLTAGTGRVAVRLTSHPVARELCLKCGCPLVSSSANISAQTPARIAQELSEELLESIDGGVLVSGPPPPGGAPSTIMEVGRDMEESGLKLLREGAISRETLYENGLVCVEDRWFFR